jgi:hypothetical protein
VKKQNITDENGLIHLNRMNPDRLPKFAICFKPKGYNDEGKKPFKVLSQYRLETKYTESRRRIGLSYFRLK